MPANGAGNSRQTTCDWERISGCARCSALLPQVRLNRGKWVVQKNDVQHHRRRVRDRMRPPDRPVTPCDSSHAPATPCQPGCPTTGPGRGLRFLRQVSPEGGRHMRPQNVRRRRSRSRAPRTPDTASPRRREWSASAAPRPCGGCSGPAVSRRASTGKVHDDSASPEDGAARLMRRPALRPNRHSGQALLWIMSTKFRRLKRRSKWASTSSFIVPKVVSGRSAIPS